MKLFLVVILAIPLFAFPQAAPRSAGFTLSFPWVNSYIFYNYHDHKSEGVTGVFGFGAALFYREGMHKFSLNCGITSSLPVPIGPFDREVSYDETLSTFWEVIYHRGISNKINLVGGVNYLRYEYIYSDYQVPTANLAKYDRTVGVTLGVEYQFTKKFTGAILYRPAIVSIDRKQYWHLISLDGRIDLTFWRRKYK